MKILAPIIDKILRKNRIKNKNMSTEIMEKHQQIYVWTKTERIGQVVVAAKEQKDPNWFYFEDGSKINPSLIKEMLIEARDADDANSIAASFGVAISQISGKSEPKRPNTVVPKPEPVAEVNVMMEMLKKMSAKNQAEMPVLVNIPSNVVYDMLQDQMDLEQEDLNEQIGLLIENQINNLQDQLRSQIQSFITNYYTK